jgi:hypothetical protein
MNNDQALYRLQTLIQYQHDKLGYTDLELLAYLERTCVENQSIQAAHVYTLYEIYRMLRIPLKSKRHIRRKEKNKRMCCYSGTDYVSLWLFNK